MHILELRDKFRDRIVQVAAECHIRTVKVFGSTIRGTATEDSDVDLLISLKCRCGFIGYLAVQMESRRNPT